MNMWLIASHFAALIGGGCIGALAILLVQASKGGGDGQV